MRKKQPRGTFLLFSVGEGVHDLDIRAIPLARTRLHAVLWPTEPMPEDWDDTPTIDQATLLAEAVALDMRLKQIQQRYGDRVPAVFGEDPPDIFSAESTVWRELASARNTIYVALTGDYTVTTSPLRQELERRHVPSSPVPGVTPY